MRRRLKDRVGLGSREAGLLLDEGGFDFFPGKDKGDKHGLASSPGFIGVRIGGQAGKAVAAVDQLFDCEEQELILRHGNSKTAYCGLDEYLPAHDPREIPSAQGRLSLRLKSGCARDDAHNDESEILTAFARAKPPGFRNR